MSSNKKMSYNEKVTVHEVDGPDVYDRSYGDGQPVKTVVYLNIAGDEKEIYNALIPQDTTILKILQDIDRNNPDSGQNILYGDRSNGYSLNSCYSFTDMKNKILNINLNTQIKDIVTRGNQGIRQAIFKIDYTISMGCNVMGGQKYYKKYKKYKKTYKKAYKKTKKSRRYRRK
jgi:hypothetical protein